jgi:hypothetical protein
MNYLTVERQRTHVESLDGCLISCNYLAHPRFLRNCNLCAGLHYVFVRFTPGRTYSKGYELRTAVAFFLDYVEIYEKANPTSFRLTEISHITTEVFLGFDSHLKKLRAPKSHLTKTRVPKNLAGRLKGALETVARDQSDGMPLLALPRIREDDYVVREPLSDGCFAQLTAALKTHIDLIYDKLDFRKKVDASAPYTWDELTATTSSISACYPDNDRSLKTLIDHGHPFGITQEAFVQSMRLAKSNEDPTNVVEAIYHRYSNGNTANNQTAVKFINLEDLLEMYFPTALDQAAIAIFIELQTGWNKETVMSIDGDSFTHPLAGAFESSQVLIVSEKQRSQSYGKPYLAPKTFRASSSKVDRHSAYRLIELAKVLSSPLVDVQIECTSKWSLQGFNPLFLCMRPFTVMSRCTSSRGGNVPGRLLSISNKGPWRDGTRGFFKRYEVNEAGVRMKSARDFSGRLRPTWIRFVRDQRNRPLSVVALQQGHASIETTDVHYDSSGPAMQARRERLRDELFDIVNLLRQKKFRGLIAKRKTAPVDNGRFRIFVVPGHERALWTCMDPLKPDWPGSQEQAMVGSRCSELSQCLFCSQVCITEDSLPFLMKRLEVLQLELSALIETVFDTPLADELEIIEYIIDEWGDEKAVKDAARYLRQHPNLLPPNMNDLSLLFED